MKIKNAWPSGNRLNIQLDDSSKYRTIEFKWYFLIDKSNADKAKELLQGSRYMITPESRSPDYMRVYVDNIYDKDSKMTVQDKYSTVLKLEEGCVKTFEGDLDNSKRWILDNNIEISDKYSKLYIDIETDDSNEKIEIGRDRILSFSAIDQNGKTYFEILSSMNDKSELAFLKRVMKVISQYDIVLGWNIRGFDIPYLKLRMKALGIDREIYGQWRGIAVIDLLKRFRHIFRFDSNLKKFSLDFIANHFLGKGKIQHKESIIEMYKNDKVKLKEYNIEDSILVKELDEKMGVSAMMIQQSIWCGLPVSQFGLYSIIDAYILKTAHKIGKFGQTSLKSIIEKNGAPRSTENPDETNTRKAKYIGAIVLEPVVGKYDRVYTFDFKGLYPSMMRTSNIGYDTLRYVTDGQLIINPGTLAIKRLDGTIKPTYFEKYPSVINLAITNLISKRKQYKDLKLKMIEDGTNNGPDWERVVSDEIIVKELSNSTYGIMGLEFGRYYSVDIAESITLFGQWMINYAKEFFESCGYTVIYGDTDSVFVSTGKETLDVDGLLKQFHIKLREDLKAKYNIDDCFIELNFDKLYESFVLVAKKSYVGHVVNIEGKKTDQIYARGLDFIKKNTFKFASKKQEDLIKFVLHKNPGVQELKDWCLDVRKEFYKYPFEKNDLVISQRVGKLEYSKNVPLHAQLAIEIMERTGEKLLHSEIEYIVTKGQSKLQGVTIDKFTGIFDRDYYWDNKTLPVLKRILDAVYPGVKFGDLQLSLF
jgi:DNA polymerase elongation subunit (family B)